MLDNESLYQYTIDIVNNRKWGAYRVPTLDESALSTN